MSKPSSVVVVGPSWVGDMVMAQSLFKLLRQQYPGVAIDVIAPAWSLPVLQRMEEVREGIALDVQHGEGGLGKRRALGKSLRAKQYDQAIVLPRSLKAALVPFFAKVPVRTGFKGEMRYGLLNDIRPLDKSVLDQTVKRFSYLGLPSASEECKTFNPSLNTDPANAEQCIEKLSLDASRFTVAFLPGAEYGPAKQWPAEHFAELARLIYSAGGQVWLMGSAKDSAISDEIIQKAGGLGENLCGKTSLADAIDLIAAADLAVTNDSGLMHVAAAVDTSLIAVYGSSSPLYTPPLTDKAEIHWLQLECSPCFERQCPLGHYNCLKQILPEQVFGQIKIRM